MMSFTAIVVGDSATNPVVISYDPRSYMLLEEDLVELASQVEIESGFILDITKGDYGMLQLFENKAVPARVSVDEVLSLIDQFVLTHELEDEF